MAIRQIIFALALIQASHVLTARGQTPLLSNGGARSMTQNDKRAGAAELTEAEKSLVEGSQVAILQAGFTPNYFNLHFRLASVVDKPGDRRIVWKFKLDDYETTVNDAVGYYTQGSTRIDIHHVGDLLKGAHDIERVVSRRQAEATLRRCIGRFTNPVVELRQSRATGPVTLLLVASPFRPPARKHDAGREERERRARAQRRTRSGGRDAEAQDEDEKRLPRIIFGIVDLETGKCIKGEGIVAS